jgi:hypothetical protein
MTGDLIRRARIIQLPGRTTAGVQQIRDDRDLNVTFDKLRDAAAAHDDD